MVKFNIKESGTREKIINAALLVAAKDGFTRATTDQIARRAGVSEGIIYHYFKSKHDLCRNMIAENAEEFRRQMVEEISLYKTAKDKLEKLIEFHFRYFTGKGNIFQAIYGKSGDSTVMMGHILKVAIIPYIQIIEAIIKQGINEGVFINLNPNIAASSLLGMMQVTVIKLHFGLSKFSLKDTQEGIKQIFFGGLLK